MAEALVAIKVKIKRGPGNRMGWPNFKEKMSREVLKGQDPSHYVDMHGIGWHYDKVSNLGLGADVEYAWTMVPEDFATEAVTKFPGLVSKERESAFKAFYDNKCMVHAPEYTYDTQLLQALAAKKALGKALTADEQDMLDPTSDKHGIRVNKLKTWTAAKAAMNAARSAGGQPALRIKATP